MTQEAKHLLFKDLCARLPYGVKVNFKSTIHTINALYDDGSFWLDDKDDGLIEEIKPYLRPLSCMTEDEIEAYNIAIDKDNLEMEKTFETPSACMVGINALDYLLSNHFDYRGLIEMGLALEAPKDMYKTKQSI